MQKKSYEVAIGNEETIKTIPLRQIDPNITMLFSSGIFNSYRTALFWKSTYMLN